MTARSIDIGRSAAEVFAYLADLDRHGEWQPAILAGRKEPPGPTRVGTRNIEIRRLPGGPREFVAEIVAFDPPRRIAAQGVSGPVRPTITLTVEPLADGTRSRVTLDLELRGYGIGKLFAPIARWRSAKQIPLDLRRLKKRLES